MIQVSVIVTVGENAADGTLITIGAQETVVADRATVNEDMGDVAHVIERMCDDSRDKAITQARLWANSTGPRTG